MPNINAQHAHTAGIASATSESGMNCYSTLSISYIVMLRTHCYPHNSSPLRRSIRLPQHPTTARDLPTHRSTESHSHFLVISIPWTAHTHVHTHTCKHRQRQPQQNSSLLLLGGRVGIENDIAPHTECTWYSRCNDTYTSTQLNAYYIEHSGEYFTSLKVAPQSIVDVVVIHIICVRFAIDVDTQL